MITETILLLFFDLFEWVNSWLPDAELPDFVPWLFEMIQSGVDILYSIFPIDHVFIAGAIVLAVEGSIQIYKLANETMKKIRGSG